ncbi:DNA (cytosine-5)-methyltransferase [Mycena chlorophos]|uniref:Cytosine-specific methyltransferase n=1 Tax=Mycena chlorophos TaxID=658473 RepID=A0A8H6SIQ6_MYCCL|nr:DNA (cytosine-5)-methyltransferase [Mycena chlorophos]
MSSSPAKRKRSASSSRSQQATSPKKRKGPVKNVEVIDLTRDSDEELTEPGPPTSRDGTSISSETRSSSPVEDVLREEELDLDETVLAGKPVRRLDCFSVFDAETGTLAAAMDLLGYLAPGRFSASGLVRVVYDGEDEEEEEDEDAVSVEGLQIIEFCRHYAERDDEFDKYMYLETKQAWYRLDVPSEKYRPFFWPLDIRQKLAHLALTADSYETLEKSLLPPLAEWQFHTEDFHEYLTLLFAKHNLESTDFPAVRRIFSPEKRKKEYQHSSLDASLEDPADRAFATPRVARAIHPHLKTPMTVVGADLGSSKPEQHDAELEHGESPVINWYLSDSISNGRYAAVFIDEIKYKIGDAVAVEMGADHDEEREESAKEANQRHCRNEYAKQVWFCLIEFFVVKNGKMWAHCIWLEHGSRTILQQTTHPQELFMLSECSDIPVASFRRKCNIHRLGAHEFEPTASDDPQNTSYFYRFIWNGDDYSFQDIPGSTEAVRLRAHDPQLPCINCGRRDEEDLRQTVVPLTDDSGNLTGFLFFGVEYHVGDFVYVRPAKTSEVQLLATGQIVRVQLNEVDADGDSKISCKIIYYDRYEKKETAGVLCSDERRLVRSRHSNIVSEHELDGKFFVKFIREDNSPEIAAWIQPGGSPNRFYTSVRERRRIHGEDNEWEAEQMDEDDFDCCELCLERHLVDSDFCDPQHPPLAALDLFAGAGGLSTGMEQTGIVKSRWAIEHSTCAVQTFQENHPDAVVIHNDVNDALRYLVGPDGELASHLKLADGGRAPDQVLPRPGQVDLIIAGPPCQSFSGANRLKREDDIRSTLPFTTVSFVEHLQPTYVVIENVVGMLNHKLTDPQGEVIKMGTVKLTLRALLALNYQVSLKILQAGDYGSAQDRRRLIITATRSGTPMPALPAPTHAFHNPAHKHKGLVRKSDRLLPPKRTSGADEDTTYAIHPAVTIKQTIGDLPKFDWSLDPRAFKLGEEDRKKQANRAKDGIRQIHVGKMPVGYSEATAYLKEPQTRAQLELRGDNELLEHHVTECFSARVVKLTMKVPRVAWACQKHIPQEEGLELPQRMRGANAGVYFGRPDYHGSFKTVLTAFKPYTSKGHFLHPRQNRVFTFREVARSQGFPDDYQFLSTKNTPSRRLKEYFRMVGNAVSLHLAAALAREIGASAREFNKHRSVNEEEEV